MDINNTTYDNTAQQIYGRTSAKVSATISADSATGSPADVGFSKAMLSANSSTSTTSLLTTAQLSAQSRPNIKQFMDKSGADCRDSCELVYGVIGANTDTRNWEAIMASPDPLRAAREATGAMYASASGERADAVYLSATDTLAQSGNFALRQAKDEDGKIIDQGLKLIDSQGLLLRDAGTSAESIQRNAWLFGFDTQALDGLVAKASAISDTLPKEMRKLRESDDSITKSANSALLGQGGAAIISADALLTANTFMRPQTDGLHATSASAENPLSAAADESAPAISQADGAAMVEANNVDSFAALPSLADAGTSPAEISILDVASKNMPPFIDTTSVLNTLMNLNNEEPGEANS